MTSRIAVIAIDALDPPRVAEFWMAVLGWQIVDYKTDVELDASVYAKQLETYREALKQMGCEVVSANIVSVRDVLQ